MADRWFWPGIPQQPARVQSINAARIDWPTLVRDLEAVPMTARSIGRVIGASHSAVLGWKNLGKEPGHYLGERLITLWCEVTGKDRDAACMESLVSTPSGKVQAHAEPQVTSCNSPQRGDEEGVVRA